MATFKALNIESDDEEDIEIDNTKEIHIEEALKLYQDALKLHSEGPLFYNQTAAAYRALFQSEIFSYPESQSELKRIELYGLPPEQDEALLEYEGPVVAGYTAPTEENTLGTLPQLIHLAQKNYGQFLLESLQYNIQHAAVVPPEEITQASISALTSFVESLDKDDTDPDLWRRTAAVSHVLASQRIARFCLEAVLDGDDATANIPSLAESLARQQLRQTVVDLQDDLSKTTTQNPGRKLSKLLRQRLSTYDAVKEYQRQHPPPANVHQPLRSILRPPKTWAEFGDHILRHALSEMHGTGTNIPGLGIAFALDTDVADIVMVDDDPAPEAPRASFDQSSLAIHQFVGMDAGKPTSPIPAFPITSLEPEAMDIDGATGAARQQPTRKRSGDAAGFQDSTEAARGRSKRVRARESNIDQTILEDETVIDNVQAEYTFGDLDFLDNAMVETVDKLLTSLDLPATRLRTNNRKALRGACNKPDSDLLESLPSGRTQRASLDLYRFLDNYSDSLARMLLHGSSNLDSTSDTHVQQNRLSSNVPRQPRPAVDRAEGLTDFMQQINKQWLHVNQVTLEWLSLFLSPDSSYLHPSLPSAKTSYVAHKWQEELKTTIVRVIVTLDDYIYKSLEDELRSYDKELLENHEPAPQSRDILANVEVIQALFELHLDVYSLIKEPNSGVDQETVITQGERTDRWSNLSRDAMNIRSTILDLASLKDELNLRYLWAATHHISISTDISREHTINCWQELRSIFVAVGSPVIEVQNNAIMPYMSVDSIDRELSILTTQDFFVKIFDTEQEDYTVVIESLEPLLEALHQGDTEAFDSNRRVSDSDSNTMDHERSSQASAEDYPACASPELLNFLRNSNTSLRVSLWQRLREAYEKIDYQPMVVCCYFRIIEMLLSELKTPSFAEKPLVERQTMLLKFIRLSHDLLSRILEATNKHENALECMDMERVETGIGAILDLLRMLHSYTLFHDDIRVNIRQPPSSANGAPLKSFSAVTKILQEMQLHSWMIMYKLLGEAMAQNKDKIDSPDNNRFDFLRSVHNVLGVRHMCGKFKGVFVNMLNKEYLRMRAKHSVSSEFFDIEFAQVLYDLYGLKVFLNPSYEQQEHHCLPEASADRHSTIQAVDLLLALTAKMKMADLLKHPIKDTIERVHALYQRKKPTEAISRNREVIRSLIKSPINPYDLFSSVHGVGGSLTTCYVPPEDAQLAAKGWYFLMGQIHLSRFRSQKRTGPTSTDDLDIAIALFNQELEYSTDNWETWLRTAQAYDSKLDENVSWSAEKLSSNAAEITQWEKSAIHCYRMAVALAMRSAEPGPETTAKLAEMFADFAMRIYASTREPFNMQTFSLDGFERFYSPLTMVEIVKGVPFRAMTPFVAWKIARGFFLKAIKLNPDKWMYVVDGTFLHTMKFI